jgi:hypothetical protein
MKTVVHVDNGSANGRFVEAAQAEMRRWHEAGYAVTSMPEDGREHRYGICPTCAAQIQPYRQESIDEALAP